MFLVRHIFPKFRHLDCQLYLQDFLDIILAHLGLHHTSSILAKELLA